MTWYKERVSRFPSIPPWPIRLTLFLMLSGTVAHTGIISNVEYGQSDGQSLRLDAYVPDGDGPFPTIIWVHGGGFVTGDKAPYPKSLLDPLTRQGFAWFSVNYRLAPKYPFPAETDDIESAVHYVKVHAPRYKVDPSRLVLMGESAGGHLVSFVGAKHAPQNRVAAVVSFFGEHDLVTRTHTTQPCIVDGRTLPNPVPICLSPGLSAFLGIQGPGPDAERIIRTASPATYVQQDMPAYLLIHGTKDYNVPIEQSEVMCAAMKKAGASCELIAIEGGRHGRSSLDKEGGPNAYQPAMLAWLRKVLR